MAAIVLRSYSAERANTQQERTQLLAR